jgi:hypothetical protein
MDINDENMDLSIEDKNESSIDKKVEFSINEKIQLIKLNP